MNFGKQIKDIRENKKITQEQMAEKLGVTRQAISNWENDKNLPDIQMLIEISKVFEISLDKLILEGGDENNMTQKLINDSNELKRAKTNALSVCVGAAMLLTGVILITIKALGNEYVDSNGILNENFFLVPIAFLLISAAMLVFLITGAKNFFAIIGKSSKDNFTKLKYTKLCFGTPAILIGVFLIILESNSGAHTSLFGASLIGAGVVLDIFALFDAVKYKSQS